MKVMLDCWVYSWNYKKTHICNGRNSIESIQRSDEKNWFFVTIFFQSTLEHTLSLSATSSYW